MSNFCLYENTFMALEVGISQYIMLLFGNSRYIPYLGCKIIFCSFSLEACLNKLAFQARNPGTICCPTCKTETPLFPRTLESVRNLPKNFGLLEILDGKEDAQIDGIQKEKEKNKYLCPEHDEALKVYCYTDNCLICIYCQVQLQSVTR